MLQKLSACVRQDTQAVTSSQSLECQRFGLSCNNKHLVRSRMVRHTEMHVAPILTDLWAEVVGRAHTGLCQLHCAAQHLGHTKVAKFEQASSRHEDILGLDISAYKRDLHVRRDGQPSMSVQNTQTSSYSELHNRQTHEGTNSNEA